MSNEQQFIGPNKERVNGEVYEWPFRVVDHHGEEIGPELDDVPPFLTREEMDALVTTLLEDSITSVKVADAIIKIPDSEAGRGEMPDGATIDCVLCNEEIKEPDEVGHAFGKFHHQGCHDEQ